MPPSKIVGRGVGEDGGGGKGGRSTAVSLAFSRLVALGSDFLLALVKDALYLFHPPSSQVR